MRIVWDRISESAWQNILPPAAASIQQSWAYGEAAKAVGRRVCRAEISTMYQRVAIAQVLIRPFGRFGQVGLVSRGPVWMPGVDTSMRRRAMRLLRRDMPGHGLKLLIATPEDKARGVVPLMTSNHLAELSLGSEIEMRAAMHGKWRNRLVKAQEAGLTLKISRTSKDLDWLLHLEAAQQKTKNYRNLPPAFLRAWQASRRDGIRIYMAHRNGNAVAAMMFMMHAPGATYQIGWTSDEGRAVCAHHRLLWQAMQDFARLGLSRLDLGTVDTVTSPGLARFKLGSGAKLRSLGPTGLVLPFPNLPYRLTDARGKENPNRLLTSHN